ncbi:MAG TPA: CAP domain-containing protein [Actinomycetota bacterium]|nr:CAP domain-containing protein [Actinomycetota bacterium]
MTKWMSSRRAAGALMGLILGATIPLVSPSAAYADPGLIPTTEAQIIELANIERLARGIRPLQHDGRLGQVAREWAHKLANDTQIYHMDVLPARRFGYKAGGENIVLGVPKITALYAHVQVMGSDLHRKNLLDPAFSHAAVGMSCASVNGFDRTVAVIQFGADTRPSVDVPPAEPQVVQSDIKAGPGVSCEGAASPPPPGPADAPEPPAPPAPAPAAPVGKKAAAPKPAPAPVAVPAPVVTAAPVVAPPPAPEPVIHVVEPEPDPVQEYETTSAVSDPDPVAMQPAVPVYQQTGIMMVAGFFGTMLLISLALAMVAGGRWHKRQLARAGS